MSNTKRSQDSVAADSNKKHKTEAAPEDIDEKTFTAAQQLQEKINDITLKASEEVIQIEQKYNEQRKPLYAQRGEMLKKIPDFWKVVFASSPEFASIIVDDDLEQLDYLEDVQIEDNVKSGFKLTFHFKTNPFFKNTSLTKELKWQEEDDIHMGSTPIQWKQNDPKLQEGFIASLFKETPDADVDISEIIKDAIWPDPLSLYLQATEDLGEDEEDQE